MICSIGPVVYASREQPATKLAALRAVSVLLSRNRCLEGNHSRLDRKKPAGKCQPAIVRLGLSVLEVSQIEDQAQNIPENAIRAV